MKIYLFIYVSMSVHKYMYAHLDCADIWKGQGRVVDQQELSDRCHLIRALGTKPGFSEKTVLLTAEPFLIKSS